MKRVLLLEPESLHAEGVRARFAAQLQQQFPDLVVETWPDGDEPSVDYPWHEVVAATCFQLTDDVADRMTGLRLLQSVTTGVEHLPVAALGERGVAVCNAAGTAAPEIAEFVLARILGDAKRLPELAAAHREHLWLTGYGEALAGAELVLVGFGPIGQRIAALASAFSMTVRVVRRTPAAVPAPGVVEEVGFADLGSLVGRARYVVSALPETPETTGLFDAELLAQVADGALIVNVGRGSLIDEPALVAECASGRLRAALDVVSQEPLPSHSPLWDVPGLEISGHCSSVPTRALAAVSELFAVNLHRLLADEALLNQVAGPSGATKESL
ncbi:D-2-hydroxyacid dehydrogenase [Nocardioides sp. Bht2]|uniref:D-2-hydroxyacid dehydrogenase n=1 Tax=Nocardioides sp. Bht2 TaxID=3392297 RepID=UPI0039B65CEA